MTKEPNESFEFLKSLMAKDVTYVPDDMYVVPHLDHGRGTEEGGPDDSDCICRGTNEESLCASKGCGFCNASSRERK